MRRYTSAVPDSEARGCGAIMREWLDDGVGDLECQDLLCYDALTFHEAVTPRMCLVDDSGDSCVCEAWHAVFLEFPCEFAGPMIGTLPFRCVGRLCSSRLAESIPAWDSYGWPPGFRFSAFALCWPYLCALQTCVIPYNCFAMTASGCSALKWEVKEESAARRHRARMRALWASVRRVGAGAGAVASERIAGGFLVEWTTTAASTATAAATAAATDPDTDADTDTSSMGTDASAKNVNNPNSSKPSAGGKRGLDGHVLVQLQPAMTFAHASLVLDDCPAAASASSTSSLPPFELRGIDLHVLQRGTDRLPDGVTVDRELHIYGGGLPSNLSCGALLRLRDVDLDAAPGTGISAARVDGAGLSGSFARDVFVLDGGGWELQFSPELAGLPADMASVEKLTVRNCESLVALPALLREVKGALCISGCSSLTALPDNLHVTGSLSANGCLALSHVPATLRVSGSQLDVRNCEALTSLPVEMLREHRDGGLVVLVHGSGIEGEALQAIRDLRTDFDVAVDDDDDEGDSERGNAADIFRNFGVSEADIVAHVDPAFINTVETFLAMLLSSGEYHDVRLRDGLRERVRDAMRVMFADEVARDEMVVRMADSIDACEDKPIWALGRMQLIAATARARGDRAALRRLGLGVMRLDVVHEHADRYVRDQGGDDVSVHLCFEIGLREPLGLPVSSVACNYDIDIDEDTLGAVKDEALAISDEAFERWLQSWDEWTRQDRADSVRAYKDLERAAAGPGGDAAVVQALLADAADAAEDDGLADLRGEAMLDPVLVLPDRGTLWSYNDVVEHWVRTGRDLSNNNLSVQAFPARVLRAKDRVPPHVAKDTKRVSLGRRRSRDSGSQPSWLQQTVAESWTKLSSSLFAQSPAVDEIVAAPTPQEPFQRDDIGDDIGDRDRDDQQDRDDDEDDQQDRDDEEDDDA